jgi:hypothetical protein
MIQHNVFFKQIRDQLRNGLNKLHGDINKLKRLTLNGQPRFNEKEDIISGLTIAINDTWAYNIYVDEYKIDGCYCSGIFRVVLWDHFGLDKLDITTSKPVGWLAGFRSWFILQHLDRFAYKPFLTKIELGWNKFEGKIR